MALILSITLLVILGGSCVTSIPVDGSSDLFIQADAGSRIVGGTPAGEGSVPYMVAMTVGAVVNSLICGGSLITEEHVLTAAHCVKAAPLEEPYTNTVRVRVGSNRWYTGGEVYNITRSIAHQDYNRNIIKNDIGILFTSTKVILSETVQLVPLSYEFIGGGVKARAAGWGYIRRNGPLPNELQELIVTTITGQECVDDLNKHPSGSRLPPSDPKLELCTYHSPGHGMCHGDSGSALVNIANGQQIGIVSWGLPCAEAAPDMFVRVSSYENWIKNTIA